MRKIISFFAILFLVLPLSAQFKTVKLSQNEVPKDKSAVDFPEDLIGQRPQIQSQVPNSIAYTSINSALKVDAVDNSAKPIQISGHLLNHQTSGDLSTEAYRYFRAAEEYIKVDPDNSGLNLINQWTDDLGQEHIKFNQSYKGINIYGAELIFHAEDKLINRMNGDYLETDRIEINHEPSIKLSDVKYLIKQDYSMGHELSESEISNQYGTEFKQWQEELVWFAPGLEKDQISLAWHIIYYPSIADRIEYWIDAHTGETLRSFSSLCKFHEHGQANHSCSLDGPATANAIDLLGQNRIINTYEVGGSYFLIDASKSMYNAFGSVMPDDPQGVIWTIDANNTTPQSSNFQVSQIGSSNNTWGGTPEGVSAHYNAERAYLYFKNVHLRESINGGGGNIVSIVNVTDENGNSMDNAFWNGFAIFYGNGSQAFKPLGRGLDVAGHEMSHGVVQNTANLEYYGESGALNESFADVFGSMIDRDDWLIGEDVVNLSAFPSGALRSMEDPHNGASTNNFNAGWQPKHTSEQFNGPEDNNGVHINSGIPNHAYYLYATAIGKSKAEKIFYRALTTYLTKSSQFVDLRNAVINASTDLHGSNSNETNAAKDAFSQVGIGQGSGTDNQQDVETNPGDDFILFSDEERNQLFIANADGTLIFNPLSNTPHISKPSITDDGEAIVFIGEDRKMHLISIDWESVSREEEIIQDEAIWRNVVISKDGRRVAALTESQNNQISVFDFTISAWNDFELYNPTFTEGIETGDVDYADAMEFDITGEIILYDAQNTINSSTGQLTYWDIGFLEVWNNASETWRLGNVSKLFTALPEGISVGNPTYSKNSPYIVAFDFIDGSDNSILGANSETGNVGLIYENTGLGYPSYSVDDSKIVYDVPYIQNGNLAGYDLGISDLDATKITGVIGSDVGFGTFIRWGVWFSNGERVLSDVQDEEKDFTNISIYPNPVKSSLILNIEDGFQEANVKVLDALGKELMSFKFSGPEMYVNVETLNSGFYTLQVELDGKIQSRKFMKIR